MEKIADIITELDASSLKAKDIFELIGKNLIVELDLLKEDKKAIMEIIGQVSTLCEFGEELVLKQSVAIDKLWRFYPSVM